MTVCPSKDDINFENPNKTCLEDLKFKITKDGCAKEISACDSYWIEHRSHARYPGICPTSPVEKTQWLDKMNWFNNELEWLLQLEHFRFWSHMCYDDDCVAFILSFLQEASPFYSPFVSDDPEVMAAYQLSYQRVLQVFCRLVTNKESESAWISKSHLAQLLYGHYLMSIPILWDLVVVYGRDNAQTLTKLIETVFKIEPKYLNDLKVALNFLKEVFSVVEAHAGGNSTSKIIAIDRHAGPTQAALDDLASHLLDCAATLCVFLELYPRSRKLAREVDLPTSVAHLYDVAIPLMFNKLTDPRSLTNIANARVELLQAYNVMLYSCVEDVLQDPSEGIVFAEEYLEILSESLATADTSRIFFADLQNLQPLQSDLELLRQSCPKLDPVKCDFVLQSLLSSLDDLGMDKYPIVNGHIQNMLETKDAGVLNHVDGHLQGAVGGGGLVTDMDAAVSEVLDVLPHLGTGFIRKLLNYLGTPEIAISAIFEGTLPDELSTLDQSEPYIPPDAQDTFFLETGVSRINVFDGDEYDVMNCDVPKNAWKTGKGKKGPKNFAALINDKSHIKELSHRYEEYNMISDNIYDDEFDDSYDGPVTQGAEEGPGVFARRPPEVPRILRQNNPCESESDPEDEVDTTEGPPPNRDMFCENPEAIRARYEANRKYKAPPQRELIGKAKGQGQEKEVVINRDKKNTQKSARANHNRRQGAQFKRNRGMMPS